MTTLYSDNFDSYGDSVAATGWSNWTSNTWVATNLRNVSGSRAFACAAEYPAGQGRAIYTGISAVADMEVSSDSLALFSGVDLVTIGHILRAGSGFISGYEVRPTSTDGSIVKLGIYRLGPSYEMTLIGSIVTTGLTLASNDVLHIKSKIVGSTISAKVWKNSDTEPTSPSVSATDTTHTAAGYGGVTLSKGSGSGVPSTDNFSISDAASTATGVTISGPTTGTIGVASSNFTVGVTPTGGAITGTVVVTPSDGGAGGTFSPTTVSLTSGAPTGTFTYTASTAGAKTISIANNGGLTNPTSPTYTAAAAATGVTMTGPATGTTGSASTNFSVGVTPVGGTISGTVVVTPSDGGGGGTFAPTTASLTSGSPTATFTYTAATSGAKTISATNNGSLTNPSNLTYTASSTAATATVVSGPTSGTAGFASANFTASANGAITGTIIITPSDGGAGGTFSPTTVSISSGTSSATFTYTAASAGAKTISFANNGSLTNATSITYTAAAVSGATFTPTMPLKYAVGGGLRNGVAVRVSVLNRTTDVPIATVASITTHATTAIPPVFTVSGPTSGTVYPVKMTNLADPTDYAVFNLLAS